MNLQQTMRRIGQQMKSINIDIDAQTYQLEIIKKLYAKNGLFLDRTCCAFPEQYDIRNKDGDMIAYYRLRSGEFTVRIPDAGGKTIITEYPNGEGYFTKDERLNYLTMAMKKVISTL